MAVSVLVTKAQEPVPVAPKPEIRFTALAWDVFDPDEELVLNYTHKKKLKPVQIPWRDRSQALPLEGAGELVFTRTVQREGKPVEVPVATAIIPEGMTRALLVFGKNARPAAGESAIRVMVIDDSYPVFPGQSVRLLNYSRMSLGGSVGVQAFEVAPGRDQVVPASLPEENRLLPFKLARRDEAGAWKKLRSTGLPMTAGLRVLVFLIDDPMRPGRAEMVLLRDRVEIEPQAPAQDLVAGVSGLRVNPRIR
ncbi:hypothetical protein FPL22_08295 [Rariglobus hedericola]|uniref:Uncharacterized protein n=2 Tax=Rariglobus hedericola TaxID=2597822 RepID=A0A556QRL7_9BACT|nr:hypothetical protein FPL22_08295 [Rariglobus hedericola]